MIWKFIKNLGSQLLTALEDSEPLKRTQKPYELPPNHSQLNPQLKRRQTICNLFANQNQSIGDIARVLDIPRTLVITTLIEEGLLEQKPREKSNELS